jgi:hypothetical protein
MWANSVWGLWSMGGGCLLAITAMLARKHYPIAKKILGLFAGLFFVAGIVVWINGISGHDGPSSPTTSNSTGPITNNPGTVVPNNSGTFNQYNYATPPPAAPETAPAPNQINCPPGTGFCIGTAGNNTFNNLRSNGFKNCIHIDSATGNTFKDIQCDNDSGGPSSAINNGAKQGP